MNNYFNKSLLIITMFFIAAFFSNCKKVALVTSTTEDVNIYGYLQKHPDQFSELTKILDRTGYDGFLNAYGSYTFFAPTNDAIKAYLTEINKPSADQIDTADLKKLIKFHVIQDTITTNAFKDGKLPLVTMYGQYLVTGVTNKEGSSSFIINRQAVVTESNITLGNGIIHVIDHVLKPATLTLSQLIEKNPNYSIFLQALKETGYYDTLNITNNPDTTRKWLTVMAETNKALSDTGITSYTALKAKYSQKNNPKDPADSLHLYVAYHIITDANYLADLVSSPSHPTLAPLEVLSSSMDSAKTKVLINDIVFNNIHENGAVLDRETSDNSATNGVLHTATAHFAIKIRQPTATYWDVCKFPEVLKQPAVYGKKSLDFVLGSLQDFTWEKNTLTYSFTNAANFPVANNDYLRVPLGLTNSARNKWVEMRTPLLVKGRYKVWVCYRAQKASNNNPVFPTLVKFDGEPFSRLLDFAEAAPSGTPGEQEALGWKTYMEIINNSYCGRLIGTIDIKTTDRHIVRMECISGAGQDVNNLDMIHFIPVNENQINVIHRRDGTSYKL